MYLVEDTVSQSKISTHLSNLGNEGNIYVNHFKRLLKTSLICCLKEKLTVLQSLLQLSQTILENKDSKKRTLQTQFKFE